MTSVIVPIYNMEKYLRKCLDSLAKQTMDSAKYEVIMIDDCSKDDSLKIAREFSKKYNNFSIIKNSENLGLARTRNVGMDNVSNKTKKILFVDSDDYVNEHFVKEMTSSVGEVVVSRVIPTKNNLEQKEWNVQKMKYSGLFPMRDQVWMCSFDNDYLRFSEDIRTFEDFYFSARGTFKKNIIFSKKAIYYYRYDEESIVNSALSESKIMDWFLEKMRIYSLITKAEPHQKQVLRKQITDWHIMMVSTSENTKNLRNIMKKFNFKFTYKGISIQKKFMLLMFKAHASKIFRNWYLKHLKENKKKGN